jgi:hypothetical protein
MAYLRELKQECNQCRVKVAKKELIDRWNGTRGVYCEICSKIKLKEQLKNEGAND